ncbi:MAG: 50S ribosomal protein L9 [Nitrospirota bacterium]
MKLILKETVEQLGKIGEIVDVADGYARNYLLPKGLGLLTTPRNVKFLEHTKKIVEDKIKKEKRETETIAQKISGISLTIPVQVGEEGQLFGSVTARDIAEAITAQGVSVDWKNILLEKPIKELGASLVSIKMSHDITAQVKVAVIAAVAPDPA